MPTIKNVGKTACRIPNLDGKFQFVARNQTIESYEYPLDMTDLELVSDSPVWNKVIKCDDLDFSIAAAGGDYEADGGDYEADGGFTGYMITVDSDTDYIHIENLTDPISVYRTNDESIVEFVDLAATAKSPEINVRLGILKKLYIKPAGVLGTCTVVQYRDNYTRKD